MASKRMNMLGWIALGVGALVVWALLPIGLCRSSGPAEPARSAAPLPDAPDAPDDELVAEPPPEIPTYDVVGLESKVTLAGKAAAGRYEARFETVQATFRLNGNTIEGSSLEVRLPVASLTTERDKLTEQIKSADFLEAERCAEIIFQSTRIPEPQADGKRDLAGNLTVHGVMKSVTVPTTITLEGEQLTLATRISVDRRDFGIERAGAPGDPFSVEATLTLDLVLRKK